MKDVAVETLPKMAVLMRRGGKWMGQESWLLSYEHRTQVTLFPVVSLFFTLTVFPSLNRKAAIQHARRAVSQNAGLHLLIPRQRGCMQTADRAAPKHRAQRLRWLRTWPASAGRWREWLCSSRVLAGFHNSYKAKFLL